MTSPTSFCSLERLISFYLQIFVLLLHTSFTMKVSPCIVDLSWAGPTCRKAAFHNQGFARHILLEHLVLSWALSSVQLLSRVQLFVTPWTVACQASLSITKPWSYLLLIKEVWWFLEFISEHDTNLPFCYKSSSTWGTDTLVPCVLPCAQAICFNKKDLLAEDSFGSLILVSGIAAQEYGKGPVAVRSAT